MKMRFAQVYRIIYYGPDDYLRGILVTMDTENGGQFIFNNMGYTDRAVTVGMIDYDTPELYKEADKQLDLSSKPSIRSGEDIILDGRTSLYASSGFMLEYYLFGIMYGFMNFPYPDTDDTLSIPLHKLIQEKQGGTRRLVVLYAVFGDAVDAEVKVKLTRVNSAFDFNGIITARTSAIKHPEYLSFIFFKNRDEKIRLEPNEEMILPLSQRFVAVPLGSQLILRFDMCIDGNKEVDTLTFVAKKEATSSKSHIVCSKGVIEVEVSWRWEIDYTKLWETLA